MARKPNPALLGAFVVGALVLAVVGLVIFGGGKFFRRSQGWVAYFDESIKGLSVGAPVLFRGVKVGAVTDIKVVVNPRQERIRTPVFFEIEAARFTSGDTEVLRFERSREVAERLMQRGLRARLETQSYVTGQLAINLDFHPDTPINLHGEPGKYPEFPTIPSTFAAIGKSLQEIDVAQLTKDAQEVLEGVARLVNGPELKSVITSANSALTGADRLMASANARVSGLGTALEGTAARANDALQDVQAVVRRLDSQTVTSVNELLARADKQTLTALNETLKDTQQLVRRLEAETVPAANQVLADLRPLVADVRKAASSAGSALERAETTLASVDGTLDGDSPLGNQLKMTLQELTAASRAFRTLSNYLERHPNSVIFGKSGKQGD
jgi:phospholipid/cholesterol/gamma-HCH transport system substrate-binding protein